VYVVWEDDSLGNYQVMFRVSNDNGTTFPNPAVNLSHDAGNASDPVMTAHGKAGDVNVVWQDNTGGNYQIMASSSSDGGITWTTPFNVSDDSGVATNPIVVARGNDTGKNVFVAWQDTTPGTSQIFAATSNNNGKAWNNPMDVSNDSSNAINPRIQNRQGSEAVYIVWTESSGGGNSQVFLSTSNNLGQTYGSGQLLSSGGNAINARLKEQGSTGTNVYAVWADNSSGNYEIILQKIV